MGASVPVSRNSATQVYSSGREDVQRERVFARILAPRSASYGKWYEGQASRETRGDRQSEQGACKGRARAAEARASRR